MTSKCAVAVVGRAGTTRFELRTQTLPDRGGLLAPFARSTPVADYLEWPLALEFYAYFNARPGTTLYVLVAPLVVVAARCPVFAVSRVDRAGVVLPVDQVQCVLQPLAVP